jgi:hypothetical protein
VKDPAAQLLVVRGIGGPASPRRRDRDRGGGVFEERG